MMRNALQLFAIVASLSVSALPVMAQNGSHGAHAAGTTKSTQNKVIQTKGIVKQIDLKGGKVTIEHEPIPELSWPAMTMRFTFEKLETVSKIKVGDKVQMGFVQGGKLSVIKSIKTIK